MKKSMISINSENYGLALTDSEIRKNRAVLYNKLWGLAENYGFSFTDSEIHRKKSLLYAKLWGSRNNYQTPGDARTNCMNNAAWTAKLINDSEKCDESCKKQELSDIAKKWGTSTTGKKSDILARIDESLENFYNSRGVVEYPDSTCSDDVIDYILREDVHIRLAKKAVNRMCAKINKKASFSCEDSCISIRNSGYTDKIFEDICQNVFINLFELAKANAIILFSGNLISVCGMPESNPFIQAMRVVQRTLSENKLTINNKEYTNRELLAESSEYFLGSVDADMEFSELRADIDAFVRYLGKRTPKYQVIAKEFVYGQILGYTQSEIFDKVGYSGNMLYTIRHIRDLYGEYVNASPVERQKGEILADLDTIRGKLTNRQATQSVRSKIGGRLVTVPMNNLKMSIPNVKYSDRTPKVVEVDWKLPVYPKSYQKVLADRRNDAYNAFMGDSFTRKQAMYDSLFGKGGEMDRIAAQKLYEEQNVQAKTKLSYMMSNDSVIVYEDDKAVRHYPVFKG